MSEDGLVPWLRAEIEEDKAAALAVLSAAKLFSNAPQRSTPLGHQVFDGSGIVVTRDRTVVLPSDVATHIAANDPRTRVADLESKLTILDEHADSHFCYLNKWYPEGECRVLRQLAYGYRHRKGYRTGVEAVTGYDFSREPRPCQAVLFSPDESVKNAFRDELIMRRIPVHPGHVAYFDHAQGPAPIGCELDEHPEGTWHRDGRTWWR